MNNFYLEIPNIKRKEDIIDYINELELYNSEINGIELLAKILDGYSFEETLENCLKRSNKEYAIKNGKNQVNTYLLIRKSDNKIVGAINIRLNYGSGINKFNGNIGYGIRPTERRKGYNKINLYLGLLEAKKLGLEKVTLACESTNIASIKTIESLGGILNSSEIDPNDGILTNFYIVNIKETIIKYKNLYLIIRKEFIMKKILCLFGIIVILTGCSKKVSDDAILSVSKNNTIEVQEFNKYSEIDVRVVYLETKLKDVYYNKDGKKYSLKEYIKTIDDVKEITSLLEDYRSYDDGGSQLFSSKEYDLSILICNKINGTSDIYIGDSNMTYSGTMCE